MLLLDIYHEGTVTMIMRIQHNIAALSNYNNVGKTTSDLQKTYEKLSSGYKINRASDDAAGLGISEKMRSQIRGMETAEKNVQDGLSLVQVADSGLASINDPNLIRMRELAVQAANDTLTDADRQLVQQEMNQIMDNINSIANNTEFNKIKLLNVPKEMTVEEITYTDTTKMEIEVTVKPGQELVAGYIDVPPGEEKTIDLIAFFGTISGVNWPDMNIISPKGEMFGYSYPLLNGSGVEVDISNASSDKATYSGYSAENETFEFEKPASGRWYIRIHNTGGGETSTFKVKSNNYYIIGLPDAIDQTTQTTIRNVSSPNVLKMQVGPNEGHDFVVDLTDARTPALGIDKIDLSTREGAEKALTMIDHAMKKISEERSKYGAYMNAFEHLQTNVSNANELLTKAESSLRDTDMAKEMTKLQKDQVLLQASQTLSAQINQMGQSILELLG